MAVVSGLLVAALVAALVVFLPGKDSPGGVQAGREQGETGETSDGTGDGEGGEKDTGELSGKVAWQLPKSPRGGSPVETLLHGWLTDRAVVRADELAVRAYDRASGRPLWQTRPPGGGRFCGVTREDADGGIAVAYGPVRASTVNPAFKHQDCLFVAMLDPATGRMRWKASLEQTFNVRTLRRIGSSPPKQVALSRAGDTVVVAYGWSVVGLDAADGGRAWEVKDVPAKNGDSSCTFVDVMPRADAAVLLAACEEPYPLGVYALDPASGRQRWRVYLPEDTVGDDSGVNLRLLSADPPVVVNSSLEGGARLITLGETGQVRHVIPAKGDFGELDLSGIGVTSQDYPRHHLAVSGDVLVGVTRKRQVTEIRDTNQVVAFDLRSGKVRWAGSLGEKNTAVPVGVDGDTVIAMRTGTAEEPPQAFRMRVSDGRATPMGPPYPRDLIFMPYTSQLTFTGEELLMVSNSFMHPAAAVLR
ncbi:PQQ-binding-like beta-propeller repeat protein [Thermoactinospora rubra]|uniref:outer membrane protein assembly factor BamB family protein n=1 Tax=Thermoactinospora rubra TaxID=1088767 RepID=UPI000A110B14|nr:PQQ-binding-like beta-propeller repeat protein [Thermoactinospora rubra]